VHTDDFFRTKPDDTVDWTEYGPGEWMCPLWGSMSN